MKKNEFKSLFNELYGITKKSVYSLAEQFGVTTSTINKWLDGKSVPKLSIRLNVAERLRAEQQKKEQVEFVGKIIKEFVTIETSALQFDAGYRIDLMFNNEMFTSTYFYIEDHKYNNQ